MKLVSRFYLQSVVYGVFYSESQHIFIAEHLLAIICLGCSSIYWSFIHLVSCCKPPSRKVVENQSKVKSKKGSFVVVSFGIDCFLIFFSFPPIFSDVCMYCVSEAKVCCVVLRGREVSKLNRQ